MNPIPPRPGLLLWLPAILSLLYLVASLSGYLEEGVAGFLEVVPFPGFTVFLMLVFLFVGKAGNPSSSRLIDLAWLIPAIMAPTALFGVWTLASSHLGGIAWGGVNYFSERLIEEYADFGPFNSEVLLGLAAVSCASWLPVLFAWGFLARWPRVVLYALALLMVPVCLVVALVLDRDLWLAGLHGAGQHSLLFLVYAPLTRTLAMLSVAVLVIRRLPDSSSSGKTASVSLEKPADTFFRR